jgi:hypothetical protein
MTSDLKEWKKDSTKALSQISRGRFMLWVTPRAAAREHEGMNVERFGHVLDLNARKVAEFHGLHLELGAIPMDLLWTLDPGHPNLLER